MSRTPDLDISDSYYLRTAYDLYDGFKGKDFEYYEHLGDVHPPSYKEKRKHNKVEYKSDASAGMDYTYSSAKDVLAIFGFGFNTLFNVSANNDKPQIVHLSSADDIISGENDACPVRPKSRNWSYTECDVVKEWLIDTGCGNDLLSKRDVASVKEYVRKAKRPVVFHTANGSTTTNSVAWIHISELDENITPYVMSNAPLVLTVGYRCMEKRATLLYGLRARTLIAFDLMA